MTAEYFEAHKGALEEGLTEEEARAYASDATEQAEHYGARMPHFRDGAPEDAEEE